jgi:transcriptional regulator with XRE-family HTH domain
MAEIPVSGKVLTWAREFRGLSVAEAADRLGMTSAELEQYETEVKLPTLTKFEKFASTYRLPQATLFRRTPPTDPKMPKDFRTFEGAHPSASFEFLVALSNVRTLQSTMRRIDEEDDQFAQPLLRGYDVKKDASDQGENERAAIGISIAKQLEWESGSGFRHWRAVIERLGIAVYLQKFELTDCRGCR